MAIYEITDSCISCLTCLYECPDRAISENDYACVIVPDKCNGCGVCAQMCPVDAIIEKA